MKISNISKKNVIDGNAIICGSLLSKLIGLMFSKNEKKCLIFNFEAEKTISLHMFFVFYPIDVIFLDKNKVVVDKKENFRPFTIYSSGKKAMYAIEMPNDIIKKSKTEVGDKIGF